MNQLTTKTVKIFSISIASIITIVLILSLVHVIFTEGCKAENNCEKPNSSDFYFKTMLKKENAFNIKPTSLNKNLRGDYDINWSMSDLWNDGIVEMGFDLFWDIDGSSGFEGFFPLMFNTFVPGLGNNADWILESGFLISLTLGAILLSIYIRKHYG